MVALLWLVLLAVIAVWFIGLLANVAGGFIHLLLIVALAILILNFFNSRRGARY